MKSSRSGFISNLTKCINCVLILTDNIQNYDEVCLLCKKICVCSFFNIKDMNERCCVLVSVEEIDKTRQLVKDNNSVPRRNKIFVNHFLETIEMPHLLNHKIVPFDNFLKQNFCKKSKKLITSRFCEIIILTKRF